MLKYKGLGEKLIFDDEGRAHQVYEMRAVDEEFGGRDVLQAAREFAEGERGKLREADVQDKELAREKKREKKRKRKEHEGEVRVLNTSGYASLTRFPQATDMDQDDGVEFTGNGADDGYVSPEFDMPSEYEDKRLSSSKKPKISTEDSLEEMALRLLQR